MSKRWYWIILVIVLLLLATVGLAGAQDGLTIVQNDYGYAFNNELVFELSLQSEEPIPEESIELLYSVGHDSDVVNRRQPDYTAGRTLTLRVRDDVDQGEIPPASTITYHWEIETAAGERIETDAQSFTYMDDRFDWRSQTQGPITIYWYGGVDGASLLNAATQALDRIETTIGYEMQLPINIVTYASKDDMQGAMSPRGSTFDEQITTLGVVVAPDVMLLLGVIDAENTVGHELTHMVVGEQTDNPFAEIPVWLNEGLAMYNQDYVENSYRTVLEEAVARGDLDTVRRLSGRTGNPDRVNLWYAEAWSLVDYLINEHSEDDMAQLLDIFSQGAHPDDALEEVYGFDRDGLTARWWQWLGAEIPPALQDRLGGASQSDGGDTASQGAAEEQSDAPAESVQEVPTQAPEAQEAEQSTPQPTGALACCLGALPLGLLIFGGLRFRKR